MTSTLPLRATRTLVRRRSGLDKLFQFYRSKPGGGCTTQDDISISQFRGVEKISSEHYVDGSCGTYQMKDVARFYEIAKKLGLEHDTKTWPSAGANHRPLRVHISDD